MRLILHGGEILVKSLGLTKVYGAGRTQIPSAVRVILQIKDGDKISWMIDDERIFIGKRGNEKAHI